MRFQLSTLQSAMLVAVGTSLWVTAAPSSAQTPERLERVEVTGSNIKRTDTEGVSPVDVITREEIQRSGRPNVAELLRTIPAISGGSFSESFANSFAPGAAGVSLRGLGEKTTLVLLNGRRVAGYGFAQNLQDSFVDLNSIPTAAVERVEILKDGASAIYGSDAIAGVINIILRKDYQGAEGLAGYGRSEGKNEYRANLTGGYGNLASDKFNIFATLDLYHRDLLEQQDTSFGKTRDLRGLQGGRNFQSLTGGGTWRQVNAAGALTNNYRAITGCPGNVLTGPQAVAAGLINLSPNLSAATLATNTAMASAANTYCSYDFGSQFTVLPRTDRYGFLSRGTYQVTPTTQGYVEVALSRTNTFQTFQNPFFAGTTALQSTPAGLRPYTYNIRFAPGVAGNPFPTLAQYTGVQFDLGSRDSFIQSDTARGVAGLTYTLGTWDFDSAAGYSFNDARQTYINRTTLAGTSAVFNVPTTPQPPIPTSTASSYNLDNPATNTQASRDAQRITFLRKSISRLEFADTKATTELQQVRLPGGPLALAVGGEYRHEELRDRPDQNAANGNILGQGITATDGARRNIAGYVEFSAPVLKGVETQLAYRVDKYSDYGTSKTPKVGIKISPADVVTLRGNWGKGFRAPTLPEISPSVATFFTSVTDPQDGVVRQVSGVFAGNPALQAETSTSSNAGIIFEPSRDFSLSTDVFKIRYRNVVASQSFQSIINNSCPGGPTATNPCPSTAQVVRDPTTNQVVTILSNYQNLNERRVTGIDVDGRYTFPTTAYGKFTAHANVAYISSFTESTTECAGRNDCTNTIPRTKTQLSLDYDFGPASATVKMNYTQGIHNGLLAGTTYLRDDNSPQFQNGAYNEKTPSFTTYDIFGKYNITKNIYVSGSVINFTNKRPPYDPGFSTTTLFDFSLYDPRGRQARIDIGFKL